MENQPWWVVIAAGVPALLVTVWQRNRDSFDKREEREASAKDRVLANADAYTIALIKRQEEDILRERARREAAERRLDEVERRMDRGWDIARLWRQKCGTMRHEFINLRSQVSPLLPDEQTKHLKPIPPPLEELDQIREV